MALIYNEMYHQPNGEHTGVFGKGVPVRKILGEDMLANTLVMLDPNDETKIICADTEENAIGYLLKHGACEGDCRDFWMFPNTGGATTPPFDPSTLCIKCKDADGNIVDLVFEDQGDGRFCATLKDDVDIVYMINIGDTPVEGVVGADGNVTFTLPEDIDLEAGTNVTISNNMIHVNATGCDGEATDLNNLVKGTDFVQRDIDVANDDFDPIYLNTTDSDLPKLYKLNRPNVDPQGVLIPRIETLGGFVISNVSYNPDGYNVIRQYLDTNGDWQEAVNGVIPDGVEFTQWRVCLDVNGDGSDLRCEVEGNYPPEAAGEDKASICAEFTCSPVDPAADPVEYQYDVNQNDSTLPLGWSWAYKASAAEGGAALTFPLLDSDKPADSKVIVCALDDTGVEKCRECYTLQPCEFPMVAVGDNAICIFTAVGQRIANENITDPTNNSFTTYTDAGATTVYSAFLETLEITNNGNKEVFIPLMNKANGYHRVNGAGSTQTQPWVSRLDSRIADINNDPQALKYLFDPALPITMNSAEADYLSSGLGVVNDNANIHPAGGPCVNRFRKFAIGDGSTSLEHNPNPTVFDEEVASLFYELGNGSKHVLYSDTTIDHVRIKPGQTVRLAQTVWNYFPHDHRAESQASFPEHISDLGWNYYMHCWGQMKAWADDCDHNVTMGYGERFAVPADWFTLGEADLPF